MQPININKVDQIGLCFFALIFVGSSFAGGDPSPSSKSVKLGKQVYNKCIGCHSMDRNRTGPKHCGLINRKAGSVNDYDYSQAMLNSEIIWTPRALNKFLKAPFDVVPGTTMGFSGIKNDNDRTALVDYLIATNNSKECLE